VFLDMEIRPAAMIVSMLNASRKPTLILRRPQQPQGPVAIFFDYKER